MTNLRKLMPVFIILLGLFLISCGAFAALTPTPAPKASPLVTRRSLPAGTQAPGSSANPTQTRAPVVPLPATETPGGLDGKTLLEQRCNACHSSNVVVRLRGTADQWAGLVSVMVQNGADLNPQEQQVLANYLAQKYH
jgi:cytochrome c5